MLVTIVYAVTADRTAPDTSRMERVEDLDPEIARVMLQDGTAREPSDDELAAYDEAQAAEAKAAEADLSKLKRDELEALAAERGVDVSGARTKGDIVAALEEHEAAQDASGTPTAEPSVGAVAPGAE